MNLGLIFDSKFAEDGGWREKETKKGNEEF